jgi:vitamin B12 transporter
MLTRNGFKIFIIFFLGILLGDGFAQGKIVIAGKVVDESNKPLPFVNIFIQNSSEGTTSGDDGSFRFSTSVKGKINLIASMVGYKKFVREIDLTNQSSVKLEINLEESNVLMKEMVVSASSYGTDKEKGLVVSSIDILTAPGGAADVFQALKTMPGLTQVSESAELYVRGGDPIETITIIDQAPVYHPFTFESSYGGLFSNLNTSVVKNLFFSSGGFSAKYGNALSGVLEVETNNLPEQIRWNVGLSLANGSIAANLPIIQNRLGLYFDVRQDFTKPILWLNGGMSRMAEAPNSKNASGALVYSYSENGRLKIFSILAQDEEGVKVDRAEYNGTFDGNSKNTFVNIQNSNILFNAVVMKNSLSYNRYNNLWQLGVLDLSTTDRIYCFRNDFEYMINNNLKLLSGFEIENRFTDYVGIIPSLDYDIRPDAEAINLNTELKSRRTGVYSELQSLKIFGIEGTMMSAGIRYDDISRPSRNWVDPRLSFGYNLSENSKLRFSWGIFHQLPDLKLFRPEDGNPNLQPMKTMHNILSYEYLFDDQNSFRIEGYYKKYYNLPLEKPLIYYDNSGYGFAEGFDLIYKGNFPLGITGWISYGYINTKRLWMDFDNYANSSFDVTHNLSVIAKYSLTTYLQLGLNVKYATGKPYTPVVLSGYNDQLKVYVPIYAPTNSGRFPDYKRIDLRITYFGQLFTGNTLIIYMEGLNIFNFDNIFGYSYTPDYSQKQTIQSYFGRRMLVFGFNMGI